MIDGLIKNFRYVGPYLLQFTFLAFFFIAPVLSFALPTIPLTIYADIQWFYGECRLIAECRPSCPQPFKASNTPLPSTTCMLWRLPPTKVSMGMMVPAMSQIPTPYCLPSIAHCPIAHCLLPVAHDQSLIISITCSLPLPC